MVGVTELTSRQASLSKVVSLAKVAYESKLDAVVCSVWEARRIKDDFGLLTITPGIRNKAGDDQRRVATIEDALREGVDYFVVGRPIVGEKNPLKAAQGILNSV